MNKYNKKDKMVQRTYIVIHILNNKLRLETKVLRYKILLTLFVDICKPSTGLCVRQRTTKKLTLFF